MSSAWKGAAISMISEVITENEPQSSSLNVNRFFDFFIFRNGQTTAS